MIVRADFYLVWFDDTKLSVALKIAAGMSRYVERFGRTANVVMVHPDDIVAVDGISIVTPGYIRRNHFYIGWEYRAEGEHDPVGLRE